jgi:hypothetical protein
MSRLRVAAERSDALVAAFRERARLVDDADGFVDLQVWRSDRDPEEVLLERYGSVARDCERHDTAHCINWASLVRSDGG